MRIGDRTIRLDELTPIDELHLYLVVSYVLGWGLPNLPTQLLWLLTAIGFYFTTPGYNGYDLRGLNG